MTRKHSQQSRRTFLGRTALSLGALTGLAGCNTLTDEAGPNLPEYDTTAVAELVSKQFPAPPNVFPLAIPDTRFDVHDSRARTLLDAVPESPDIPNEAIAERIARERSELADRMGDMTGVDTPCEQLGRWRYYRHHAAEVWGAYQAATSQYDASDFDARYDRLRADYSDFTETWDYRGTDPTAALVVHHAIEELVSRGLDDILATGPFSTDPQAAVFEAARMIQAHEQAAALLGDAETFQTNYLSDQPDPSTHRLVFAAATDGLRHPIGLETHRGIYERALDEGESALGADLDDGPAERAFTRARHTARFAERDVEQARNRNDPATATIQAARYRHAHRVFSATVDAIQADDIAWPADIDAIRALRTETVQALEAAWNTDPRHLSTELTSHATGLLRDLRPRTRSEADIDGRDIADYVGTLHYAKRYAAGIPALTREIVAAITQD